MEVSKILTMPWFTAVRSLDMKLIKQVHVLYYR